MPKIGRFIHADDCIARKTYGFDRGLTIVLYQAYDAGIIGYEHNGIALLDDDNGQVVLDLHQRELSGYSGPSSAQRKEFERLKAMSWQELGAFVASHPRYRQGSAGDLISGGAPERGNLVKQAQCGRAVELPAGPDIRTPEMIAATESSDSPYSFPLKSRAEIIAALLKHDMHTTNHQFGCALAWNIKVHSFDETGRTGDSKVDARLDALWSSHVEKDGDVFWSACSDAVSRYVDGTATTWPGDDEGQWDFRTEGRSGGWLILSRWQDQRMEFSSSGDLHQFLDDLSDEELAELYKGISCFDQDLASPKHEMDYQFNFRRAAAEEHWKEFPVEGIARAVALKLEPAQIAVTAKSLSVGTDALVEAMRDADADGDVILDTVEALSGPQERARVAVEALAPSP